MSEYSIQQAPPAMATLPPIVLDFRDVSILHHIAKTTLWRYEINSSWPNVFTAWVFRLSDDVLIASDRFASYDAAARWLEIEAFAREIRSI